MTLVGWFAARTAANGAMHASPGFIRSYCIVRRFDVVPLSEISTNSPRIRGVSVSSSMQYCYAVAKMASLGVSADASLTILRIGRVWRSIASGLTVQHVECKANHPRSCGGGAEWAIQQFLTSISSIRRPQDPPRGSNSTRPVCAWLSIHRRITGKGSRVRKIRGDLCPDSL